MDRRSSDTGVVYICDQRYHELTEFSIASLVLAHNEPLSIYFFQAGYSLALNEQLAAYISTMGHTLKIIELDRTKLDLSALSAAALHPHISDVTLLKAHAIDIAAQAHEMVVFADSDLLFFDKVSFSTAPEFTTTFAGVHDFVSYMPFDGQDLIRHTERTGVSSDYFNAGFLLINSARWIERKCFDLFLDNVRAHSIHCPYRHDNAGNDPGDCKGADQCALNMTAQYDWTPIDFRWNAQKPIRHTDIWNTALVRHYTGHRKFLAKSNVNRDRREWIVLNRIQKQVGLTPFDQIRYDAGALYMLDAIKYHKVTGEYKRLLRKLNERIGGDPHLLTQMAH
jgi:lipopolysaccharide biosynthesis glycosyltransferase